VVHERLFQCLLPYANVVWHLCHPETSTIAEQSLAFGLAELVTNVGVDDFLHSMVVHEMPSEAVLYLLDLIDGKSPDPRGRLPLATDYDCAGAYLLVTWRNGLSVYAGSITSKRGLRGRVDQYKVYAGSTPSTNPSPAIMHKNYGIHNMSQEDWGLSAVCRSECIPAYMHCHSPHKCVVRTKDGHVLRFKVDMEYVIRGSETEWLV
jgi:hypothetical protein